MARSWKPVVVLSAGAALLLLGPLSVFAAQKPGAGSSSPRPSFRPLPSYSTSVDWGAVSKPAKPAGIITKPGKPQVTVDSAFNTQTITKPPKPQGQQPTWPGNTGHPWWPNTSINTVPQPTYPTYPVYPAYPATPVQPEPIPQGNYLPTSQPEAIPQRNDVVVEEPEPEALPTANDITGGGLQLTQQDIDAAKDQIQEENKKIADNIADEVAAKSQADPDFAKLPPSVQQEVLKAIKEGDPVKVKSLTQPYIINSGASNLVKDAKTVLDVRTLAKDASNGTATQEQINNVSALLGPAGHNFLDGPSNVSSLATNNKIAGLLASAQPGDTTIPPGDDATIVLTPAMPDGTIVSMGNGAVMVGTGGATDGTMVGNGNVAEVAGMSVPIGAPVPEDQSGPVNNGVLLMNGEPQQVNYGVNDNPFSMGPGYTQTLPAGQTWVVSFDRGGSFGAARYSLDNGTYKFTATDRGWELYKQSYKVTLNNTGNKRAFNYVRANDNRQYTTGAGDSDTIEDAYPVVIRFDNGKGEIKRKRMAAGTYQIVAHPGTGIDLYPAEAVRPPVRDPNAFPVVAGKRVPPGFKPFAPETGTVSTASAGAGSSSTDGADRPPIRLFSR